MSLRIVYSTEESLTSSRLLESLTEALASFGRCTLLVPSRTQALQLSRELAEAGLSMGITVDTPQSWAEALWELYGDGARLVEGSERLALLSILLATSDVDSISQLPRTPGTLQALVELVCECAAWLPLTPEGSLDLEDGRIVWLSRSEQEILALVGEYLAELQARRRIELSQIMYELPRRMAAQDQPAPVMLVGFTRMQHAAREFVCDLAASTTVSVFAPAFEGPSGELARSLAADLASRAQARSVQTEEECEPTASSQPRSNELQALLDALYQASAETSEPVHATGSVRLLEAAGPIAEGSLLAEEIERLCQEGARELVLCVSDVERAWNDYAPKLVAKGLRVQGALMRKGLSLPQTRSLLGFAEELARLAELEWPETPTPGSTSEGETMLVLGDMSWWPPRRVSDFLLSELSGMDAAKAWNLDARFRGDRVLSPVRVFESLQREALTSRACVQATAALLEGHISQAVGHLYNASYLEDEDKSSLSAEALAALGLVQQAAESLRDIGVRYVPNVQEDGNLAEGQIAVSSLSVLYALVKQIVSCLSIVDRREVGPEDAACTVRICTRSEAAMLPPCSTDALLVSELSTQGWPVRIEEGAVEHLLEALNLTPEEDGVAQVRSVFAAAVRAARSTLVLERALRDEESKLTYPAIPLIETLAAYGLDIDEADPARAGLEVGRRAETLVSENLSASTRREEASGRVSLHPTGQISERSRELVVVVPAGKDVPQEGEISLSASQIESYLECPYKWFTMRRLGLRGVDAEFSAMEVGAFVHRVLEQTRSRALLATLREQGIIGEGVELRDLPKGIGYIREAAVDADTLPRIQELLELCIREDLDNQALAAHTRSAQSLIPHSFAEEARLARIGDELHSLLNWEQTVLSDFAPRYFELRFGGGDARSQHVQYAGVDLVGTIDRIDVDSAGRAIVIDYKHKSPKGFEAEYNLFPKKSCSNIADFALPRRVQSLIYAQIVRRLYPELDLRGAVYISTRSDGHGSHAMAGVLDTEVAYRAMGTLDSKREAAIVVGENTISFTEVLDRTEELIAEAIACLRAGEILANPADKHACEWCPALRCERRLS